VFKSYSQNFEDVYINRLFHDKEKGFYIDVGAHHPEIDSVTKSFYDRGWNGINIEPTPENFKLLYENRPRDINLNVAISDFIGKGDFFDIKDTGLSTLDEDLYNKYKKSSSYKIDSYEVDITTLDQIYKENSITDVDFLKIDAENSEKKILLGFSLFRHRPTLIIIESTYPNSQEIMDSEWEYLFTEGGYIKVFFDGLNNYYLKKESIELAGLLKSPVSVFDNFYSITGKSSTIPGKQKEFILDSLIHKTNSYELLIEKQKKENASLESKYDYLKDLHKELVNIDHKYQSTERELHAIISHQNSNALQLDSMLNQKDMVAANLENEIKRILNSNSWRISAPLRLLKFKSIKNAINNGIKSRLLMIKNILKKILKYLNIFQIAFNAFKRLNERKLIFTETPILDLDWESFDSNANTYRSLLCYKYKFNINNSPVIDSIDSRSYTTSLKANNEI
jgi:FkbM family methyltransferase